MEIEIAEHGRMTESGRSLLRLIRNQDIPLLDLLVRESVQNSLDAAADGVDHVCINIITGDFNAECLNRHFDTIADALDRKYSGRQKFIAISDSGTVGLTGPVRYSDIKNNNFGNLLKLVYEISKPQQNAGAGGSWGLGKTIYFRTGTGLVIYYSRIRENGQYQSRLAACLVEDETAADTLIPYSGGVRRGIAWWGKKDDVSGSSTVPQQISNVYLSPENGNSPIVMFTRQPGMIVGYDYEGQWTHRMPRSEPDRYIICLFVADSKNRLKNIRDTETGNNMSLEEYIRQGEKADHASWTDRNIGGANPKIIAAIQRNVINKIRKKYTEVTPGSVQKQNTGVFIRCSRRKTETFIFPMSGLKEPIQDEVLMTQSEN